MLHFHVSITIHSRMEANVYNTNINQSDAFVAFVIKDKNIKLQKGEGEYEHLTNVHQCLITEPRWSSI